jgi:hypothetical protein
MGPKGCLAGGPVGGAPAAVIGLQGEVFVARTRYEVTVTAPRAL